MQFGSQSSGWVVLRQEKDVCVDAGCVVDLGKVNSVVACEAALAVDQVSLFCYKQRAAGEEAGQQG